MMSPALWLAALWVALWGDVSLGTVLAGIAIAFALEIGFPTGAAQRHHVRPVAAVAFGAHMLWSIVTASLRVIVAVLRPTPERTAVSIIDVPLVSMSATVAAVTVNTISLTPGTLTIDHDQDSRVITVHVLGTVDEDDFKKAMLAHEQRVARFLIPIEKGPKK